MVELIIGIIALGLVELFAFLIQKLSLFKKIESKFLRKITARITILLLITISISLCLLLIGVRDINVLGIFFVLCLLYFIMYLVVHFAYLFL
jgi:uncharacterized protein with PQ loop repeat